MMQNLKKYSMDKMMICKRYKGVKQEQFMFYLIPLLYIKAGRRLSVEKVKSLYPNPDKPEPQFCHFAQKIVVKYLSRGGCILGIEMML